MAEERKRFLARPQADPQARGAITLPGVGDLQSKAETFLQSAKLAIAATGNLTHPLYGKGFVHHFHKFEEWARTTFGDDDHLTVSIRTAQPFVARVVRMRNAVDHPDTAPGAPMRCANFDLEIDGTEAELVDPRWGVADEPLEPMLGGFDIIIELSLCLGEGILVDLFYKFRQAEFLVIYEIPLEDRDPSNPKRLTVSVAPGFDQPKR